MLTALTLHGYGRYTWRLDWSNTTHNKATGEEDSATQGLFVYPKEGRHRLSLQ
jgi:hypothetical protein